VNRVQGVDEDQRAGDGNAGFAQALAEAAEEIDLTERPQAGLAQEDEEFGRACLIHAILLARNLRDGDGPGQQMCSGRHLAAGPPTHRDTARR
jgi:hypothetical protein